MDLLVVIAAFNVYQKTIAQATALVTETERAHVRMDLVGATVLSKTYHHIAQTPTTQFQVYPVYP
jgi:hypothetical protein